MVQLGVDILTDVMTMAIPIATLFGIVVAIEVGIKIYHFVMWVLKKIPMLGVS